MRKLALAASFGLCHSFGKHALMNVTFPLILKAAKPVTTVQEGVLTFVSMKPLDVL